MIEILLCIILLVNLGILYLSYRSLKYLKKIFDDLFLTDSEGNILTGKTLNKGTRPPINGGVRP